MAFYYLDEHVDETLVPLLADLGHDVLSTRQTGNKGLTDPRQLQFARRHGRVMVMFNDWVPDNGWDEVVIPPFAL